VSTVRAGAAAPAVAGPGAVRDTLLPYGRQTIEEDDVGAVVAVLRSDWITTGPKIAEFEEAFAARVGARYAVSFSSGTAALHGAAYAAGLGAGDEAVTTPLTFCATANCLLYVGATPVFADVRCDTLTLDPDDVARRLSARTRAILPVDYAGHPADLTALGALAERRGLVVIEDAAHALGATHAGRPVGSISHMTVFSFHPVKHITTGEGGMVTTNDPTHAHRLRLFRTHGIESTPELREREGAWVYDMVTLGFNYRLTDIACALGRSQLRRLDALLARRRAIADHYTRALRGLPGIILPVVRPEARPAWHLYPVRLNLEQLRAGRAEIFAALRAENLGVQVHYIPVHLLRYYRERFGYRGGEYPVAEDAYRRLLSLPLFPAMTDQDANDVVRGMRKVLSGARA
jgi:UDP-4-amino-4,6-dideoxy-N-acetyl-beta-L-altrosamine transaminase